MGCLACSFTIWAAEGNASVTEKDSVYCYGIDISHHNPEPEWRNLDIDFVIMKATEGSTYVDPTFRERLDNCKKAGIPAGAYHYYRGNNPTEEEFENFRRTIGRDIDIIPVVDIEKYPKNVQEKEFLGKLRNFISLLEEEYGVMPIIYAKESFYKKYLEKMLEEFSPEGNYHLWIGETDRPYSEYDGIPSIYQTQVKNLKGISGLVDFNELHRPFETILLK